MHLIVCSTPENLPDEQALVRELLREGLTTFHLRKPSFSEEEMRSWLEQLTDSERQQVVIHSHWPLAQEFSLKGIHYGATALQQLSPETWQQANGTAKARSLTVSSSVHNQEEIDRLPEGVDYVWLSPVFESISKAAYASAYSAAQFDTWVQALQHQAIAVYALGGISDRHLQDLSRRRFDGAVVLGFLWKDIHGLQDLQLVKQRFKQLINSCKTDLTS